MKVPKGGRHPSSCLKGNVMTAKITEISDGGSNPKAPSVEQMRESQRMGSVGKGTQSEDYAEMEACFNMGTGKDGAPDKTAFPRWSNDEEVAEYPDGDGDLF
jgi:hypothetical protein